MENIIPTAEEFYLKLWDDNFTRTEIMIEFAKLHVQAALKEASKKATIKYSCFGDMDAEGVESFSILNAYPLTKIN